MKLVFLGPPGAGKGTMASRLARHMNIPHISTGEIIRTAIRHETDLGKKVKELVEDGGLVPDDLTIQMVEKRLRADDVHNGYIFDGFPRTLPQAESFSDMDSIDQVIDFELEDEEIIKRLSGRRIHKASGRTYHILFNPPRQEGLDDVTGEALSIRPDDSEEAVAYRLKVYRDQTEPLIGYYSKKGLLRRLDATPSTDSVFTTLVKLLNS